MDQSMRGPRHFLILALMLTGFGFRLAQAQIVPAPSPDGKSAVTPADSPIGDDQRNQDAPPAPGNGTRSRARQTDCACPLPRDCSDYQTYQWATSGVYTIYVGHMQVPVQVYCDMTTDDGGWTVFQRRRIGNPLFFRSWNWYRFGFGNPQNDHWLGLHQMYAIMSVGSRYQLRIELGDFSGSSRYAAYDDFKIGPLGDKYRLTVSGYSGDAGDSFSIHSGYQFSTYNRDNDAWGNPSTPSSNCAANYKGGWWYHACYNSNLNGRYYFTNPAPLDGIIWSSWLGNGYSLKFTEMKFRRYAPDF